MLVACKPPQAGPAAAKQSSTAITVSTSVVHRQEVARVIIATGTVAAWQELIVGAPLGGLQVVDVPVKENDAVRAGDILLKFDDRALLAQAAHQRAIIAEAEGNLRSATSSAERGEALVAGRIISQETIETRRIAVLTSQAKLDQARAGLDQLQVQLDQTLIRAPADGIVLAEPVRIGSVPQAGSELARLLRDGRLEVQVRVPERDVRSIARGQTGRVRGPDGIATMARVRDVAARVDPTTRLATVYLELPSGTVLKPGMFATVEIAAERQEGVMIPEQALVWSNGRASAFVVGPDRRVGLRTLVTGDRRAGHVLVTAGLADGDQVVTIGAGFLADGDAVRIEPALTSSVRVTRR